MYNILPVSISEASTANRFAVPLNENLISVSFLLDIVAIIALILLVHFIRSRAKSAAREKIAEDKVLGLQSVVDSIPLPIFYKDLQGRYIGCNRAFEAVLGKAKEDIVGRTVYEVAPSDLAEIYHKADLDLIARKGQQSYEAKVLFGDGVRHDILFHKGVFSDQSGEIAGMVGTMLDISEQKLIERDLLKSDDRYRAFIRLSREGIWMGDLQPPVDITLPVEEQVAAFIENLTIVECNDALAKIYGYDQAEDMIGRRTREFYDLDQIHEVLEALVSNNYELADYETRQFDRHGNQIWLASSFIGIPVNGKIDRVWGVRRDITEKKRQLETLEYQANHDSLTALPNRYYLKKQLEKHLEMLDDHGQIALFILDLDRFKEVNDTLSHHAGDLLLIEFAKRLQQVLYGVGGEIVRLGGDEFAIIYTRVRNERDIYWLAELMLKTMQLPFDIESIKVEISGSFGIALAPAHGVTTSSLLRCADVAMYQAKKEMKRFCLYDPDHDPYTPERLALMNELGGGIRANQLVIHYQPKIDLANGVVAGFEALVRWNHPERGLLMPAEFIPFAEIGELIVPLTYQVIEKSIQQLKKWQDDGIETSVACNLSARLLMDEDVAYHIEAFLANYGVKPSALELEITETALIAEPERAREILNRISSLGVNLSIDDFGTGYSSLALLKSLPLNALKIDLQFVSQMLVSEQDAVIVSSTINLAHNLGLEVVAEGVECRDTLEKLRQIDCDQAQGYYIGLPMCAEKVTVWMEREAPKFSAP